MEQHTWPVDGTRLGYDASLGSVIDLLNHELRTPLAALLGHSELLHEMDLEVPDQARRSMAAMNRACSKLAEVADLVSRLADFHTAAQKDAERPAIAPLRPSKRVRMRHSGPAPYHSPRPPVVTSASPQGAAVVEAVDAHLLRGAPVGGSVPGSAAHRPRLVLASLAPPNPAAGSAAL